MSRAQLLARVVLAVALLLTLVAGNLVMPAAATGSLCTLACCAGRAPHAAGSCMQGSCAQSFKGSHSTHHHSEQLPANETSGDVPAGFEGVTAGAHGADLNNVPTIDAAAESTRTEKPSGPSLAVSVLTKPCAPDCGVCTPGFQSPKRSRGISLTARFQHALQPTLAKLTVDNQFGTPTSPGFDEHREPRGPPSPAS